MSDGKWIPDEHTLRIIEGWKKQEALWHRQERALARDLKSCQELDKILLGRIGRARELVASIEARYSSNRFGGEGLREELRKVLEILKERAWP